MVEQGSGADQLEQCQEDLARRRDEDVGLRAEADAKLPYEQKPDRQEKRRRADKMGLEWIPARHGQSQRCRRSAAGG
jgi:hypothetical protein